MTERVVGKVPELGMGFQGTEVTSEDMASTQYVGPVERLQGKAAMVQEVKDPPNTVLAQFTDMSTGYGNGWHPFPKGDFLRWSNKS